MHAARGRVLSLKRKRNLERQQSRGRGDLSETDTEGPNSPSHVPWYISKWDERRKAFSSAKSTRGISLFHMFAIVALLGVGLMVGSFFVGPAAGLLEIGVSAFLFSIFCLVFVRCDDSDDYREGKFGAEEQTRLSDIVVEQKGEEKEGGKDEKGGEGDQMQSLLSRSSPRNIPSPLRIFGYALNFSPIPECSEPSSTASSWFHKAKLPASSTQDSLSSRASSVGLSKVSSAASALCGTERGGPINEEEEDKLMEILGLPDVDAPITHKPVNFIIADDDDDDGDDEVGYPYNLSVSNLSPRSNSASFDTDDSITADLSVVTVIERKDCANKSPGSDEVGNGNSPQ